MTEEKKVLLAWTSSIVTSALNLLYVENVDEAIDFLIDMDTSIKDALYNERTTCNED